MISTLSKREIIKRCRKLISEGGRCGALRKTTRDCRFLAEQITPSGCKSVITLNSLMAMMVWKRADLKEALKEAELITADSIGVLIATRLLGGRCKRKEKRSKRPFFSEQITPNSKKVVMYPGIEMMEDLIKERWRVFLLGGKNQVADRAAANIKKIYPQAQICGTHHGYFREEEDDKIIAKINGLRPDIVFVGFNLPRQEIWIKKHKDKIAAGIIMGIGGSLDIFSGNLTRAPYIFRALYIEWLWRLILEPWRLIRIIKLPVFVMDVTLRFFSGKKLLE